MLPHDCAIIVVTLIKNENKKLAIAQKMFNPLGAIMSQHEVTGIVNPIFSKVNFGMCALS